MKLSSSRLSNNWVSGPNSPVESRDFQNNDSERNQENQVLNSRDLLGEL